MFECSVCQEQHALEVIPTNLRVGGCIEQAVSKYGSPSEATRHQYKHPAQQKSADQKQRSDTTYVGEQNALSARKDS